MVWYQNFFKQPSLLYLCSYSWKLNSWIHTFPKSIKVSKVKLAIIVEGDQKAPFSIATTLRCSGGHYSFPWIAPLYHWYIPYIAECQERGHQVPFLKSLVWCHLGLNPGLPDHWQTLYPLGQWAGKRVLALCEIPTASFRIWTQVAIMSLSSK